MGNAAPKSYLKCDGAVYNIADYQLLANHFKTEFGSYNYFGGNGATTFAVPDLRGEFLRGTGAASRNTGAGGSVGTHQNATIHQYTRADGYSFYVGVGYIDEEDSIAGGKIHRIGGLGNEYDGWTKSYTSRPTNTSVLWCIKYA